MDCGFLKNGTFLSKKTGHNVLSRKVLNRLSDDYNEKLRKHREETNNDNEEMGRRNCGEEWL